MSATAAGTLAPAPAHLSVAEKAAYYSNAFAQHGASQQAPKAAPAAVVYYETRWWVPGNRRATLSSSPTTTAEFAQRNAAHYRGKGYEAEAVSVDSNGRKKVL